jgi:hypothetical protein
MMWIVYRRIVDYDGWPKGATEILFVTVSGPEAKGYAEGHNKEAYRSDGDHYQYTYQEVEVR